MTRNSILAGVAAVLLIGGSAMAQPTNPPTGAQADNPNVPLKSTNPDGTPYSDTGSGLPADPSNMPRMNRSPSASQNGSDSAAQTPSEAKTIDQCKAMSASDMASDPTCAKLMKKHPTMMNGGDTPPK